MRFERVWIRHFGRLSDLDTGAEPLGPLVAVYGPNEAGKTTFFSFLTTLLYGFQPSSSQSHPYAPWSGDEIDGGASLITDEGASVRVQRRLRSTPWGRFGPSGTELDLRNRPLPLADHVPRPLYTQVFALTLREMAGMEDATWAEIQDHILGALVSDELRSTRAVTNELLSEAGAIWRPNRRGSQRVRELAERIRELRLERRSAADRERDVRETARTLDTARQELLDLKERRASTRASVAVLERLTPVQRNLQRARDLSVTADDPKAWEGLASDPLQALAELTSDVARQRERVASLEKAALPSVERVNAWDTAARGVVAAENEVRDAIERAGKVGRWIAEREAALTALADVELRLTGERRQLEDEDSSLVLGALLTLPLAEVGEQLRLLVAAREERRVREDVARFRKPTGGGQRQRVVFGIVALVLGLALIVSGLVRSWDGLVYGLGGALATWGVIVLAAAGERWRRARTPAESEGEAALSHAALERARAQEVEIVSALEATLAPLSLASRHREQPGIALAATLERARDLLVRREALAGRQEELIGRIDAAESSIRELGLRLGIALPLDAGSLVAPLQRALDGALGRRDAAARSEDELARVRRERALASEELAGTIARRSGLEQRLAELGGSVEQGARLANERRQAYESARAIHADLEREVGKISDLEAEISAYEKDSGESVSEGVLRDARAQEQSMSDRLADLAARVEGLTREVDHARGATTLSQIDGEIETLEEERGRFARDRDRKVLLASVVQEADRRFREKHQPDVLRRSGAYLSSITDGRYDRLVARESDGAAFLTLRAGDGSMVDLRAPLSTGTREQLFLALRLALVDHLDAPGERLPLFIDEGFVNWDRERRERGLRLLTELGARRQVFVFTCHRPVAATLQAMGAQLIALPGPEETNGLRA